MFKITRFFFLSVMVASFYFMEIKASPLEEAYEENNISYTKSVENYNIGNFNNSKKLFKDYLKSYKEIFNKKNEFSPDALKLILKNQRFIEIGKIKAFSKVHGGVRGKVLYIYKDYGNEVENLKLKNSDKLYILTTFVDQKILKNRKLKIQKYMENISIRQTGVSNKKKEII